MHSWTLWNSPKQTLTKRWGGGLTCKGWIHGLWWEIMHHAEFWCIIMMQLRLGFISVGLAHASCDIEILWNLSEVHQWKGSVTGFLLDTFELTLGFNLWDALLPNQTLPYNAAASVQAWISTSFQVVWQQARFNFASGNCWGRKACERLQKRGLGMRVCPEQENLLISLFLLGLSLSSRSLPGDAGKMEFILNLQLRRSFNENLFCFIFLFWTVS